MTSKLLEKILLTRILREVSSHGLFCNEPFGFISKHTIALLLHKLVDRVYWKFDEKWLKGVVFLDVLRPPILYSSALPSTNYSYKFPPVPCQYCIFLLQ
jgi:hypothetical protein